VVNIVHNFFYTYVPYRILIVLVSTILLCKYLTINFFKWWDCISCDFCINILNKHSQSIFFFFFVNRFTLLHFFFVKDAPVQT
jgi:hypothetical protein